MKNYLTTLFLATTLALSTGCTINATAVTPSPNVLAGKQIPGSVVAKVTGVTDERLCSHTDGLKDVCVTRLKTAMTTGLADTLPSFFTGSGEAITASFKMVEFSHNFASAGGEGVAPAVRLAMKWQFVLRTGSGKSVFQMTGSTASPPMVFTGQSDEIVKSLLSTIIEEIGAALNKASVSSTSADADEPPDGPAAASAE